MRLNFSKAKRIENCSRIIPIKSGLPAAMRKKQKEIALEISIGHYLLCRRSTESPVLLFFGYRLQRKVVKETGSYILRIFQSHFYSSKWQFSGI
jgi:hypothetical protein